MFPDNSWYSHRLILSRYATIKDNITHCSIQHGSITVSFNKNFGRLVFPFSKYLIWNKRTASICSKNKHYNFEIIGAPFLYLDKLLNKKNFNIIKNSYFVMAPHASENIPSPFFHEKFIKYIKNKIKGKITVCIFYHDRNQKIENLYKKEKINIFSCGKRNNKKFLYLLYYQLKKNENIIITELGSPLFYSLFLNKKTYFIQKFSPQIILNNNENQIKKYKKKYSFLFNGLSSNKIVNAKLGKKLADDELGVDYIKNSREIRDILWPNNSFLKIYAYIFKFLLYLKWRKKLLN